MISQSTILVGTSGRDVWIRVEGKGSFQNSGSVKDFTKEMIQRGHRDFWVDLKACPVMDSTFMGTLAGLALRLREIGQGSLHVINLNERNSGLLRSLGLDQLFMLEPDAPPPLAAPLSRAAKVAADEGDKEAAARVMLEAHEALVEVSGDNLSRFKDVLEYLKQDLQHNSKA